jgi:hypothetical protein
MIILNIVQKTVTASEGLGDLKITEAPCDLYFHPGIQSSLAVMDLIWRYSI